MKIATLAVAFLVAWVLAPSTGRAQTYRVKEHAELAKALKGAKILLQRGLAASAKEGKSISAKYEVEDGKLQLSVYTMRGDTFSEAIVDHKTGEVAKAEPITGGDDLATAKVQAEAMAKVKRSLDAAAAGAVKKYKGYRVVSVTPALKDGHPRRAMAAPKELRVPDDIPVEKFDFESKEITGWTTVAGQWAVEEMAGAPSGERALESNFRLYHYERGRRQLATASVRAPALGQWHTLRLVAIGDHIQAWLDGNLYLDHPDSRFESGRGGLWTKADSITAFDDLAIRGVTGGG